LRCAVQWRKVSFGSRSAHGEIAVARLLTVTRTCRMQNREPLDYLGTAIRSHRNTHAVPSLLKTAPTTWTVTTHLYDIWRRLEVGADGGR
ncbi:MAG: transposase, partial [Bryobacterales bacterium]|nr:transposase [Bryobacterales bacterium]